MPRPLGARHITALDGIRGLAILAVMFDHAQIIWDGASVGWWRAFTELGQHGVDLFFVLSGFLITGILDASRESEHYFRNFYLRRALRIFPLYYLFLAIAFFVQPHLVHKPDVAAGYRAWFWLYGSNFLISRHSWFETSPFNVNLTWSLAIEEQFYIVWPMIVLLFRGAALRRICIGVVCFSTLFRLCAELMHTGIVSVYVLTPSRLDALALGAWTVLALRDPAYQGAFWIKNRLPIGIAALTVGVIASLCASRFPETRGLQEAAQVADMLAFAIGFAALISEAALVGSSTVAVKVLSNPLLVQYGKLSYFIYLFHWPVMRICTLAIRYHDVPGTGRFGVLSGPIFWVLAFFLPLLPAWISWQIFEKQLLKLKRFFPAHEGVAEPVTK